MKHAITLILVAHYLACFSDATNSTYSSRRLNQNIQNGFITFSKTTCNKSNPGDYEVKKTSTNCKSTCERKKWCMGYEKSWTQPRECLLFRSAPTPGEPQDGFTCAQASWRSPAPSAYELKFPTSSPASTAGVSNDDNWRFLVFADVHSFTEFSWNNLWDSKQTRMWKTLSWILKDVRKLYGGELVMLPGDEVSYGPIKTDDIIAQIGGNLSPANAVYKAGFNSHKAGRKLFEEAGYSTVLATIGDHDIGGDEGFLNIDHSNSKIRTIPSYRRSFGDGFNRDEQKRFLFDQSLGGVPSRPVGTAYQDTSFAYVHKNALFVTVDAFQILGDGTEDFMDRNKGNGGKGAVTCTVSGDHLTWFKRVLIHGKNSAAIKHIFVQAHLPIIQPVQKVDCTGQFFDSSQESNFWQLMNKYGVDIYFAGEVHANTATKSSTKDSNLIQIVSRGVRLGNIITVDVSDDVIDVKIFNEFGDKKFFNGQYAQSGHLTIDKSSEVTKISSSGALELLDLKSEILVFDFEEILPMGERQVLGLFGDDSIMAKHVKIRNKICRHSMSNKGGFGAQYDAQVTNIALTNGRNKGEYAGLFSTDSRFGIYGTGPYSGGEIISFGIWIRTMRYAKKMVLVHHANYWGSYVPSIHPVYDHFTLALDNGSITINTQPEIQWRSKSTKNLADGKWHHIAVSMPRKSCKLIELDVFLDGKRTSSHYIEDDRPIFQTTSGRISLGGFGYSDSGFEMAYPGMGPYVGALDDFRLFSRPLNIRKDFPSLVKFRKYPRMTCKKSDSKKWQYIVTPSPKRCDDKCRKHAWCLGFERRRKPRDECILFNVLPTLGKSQEGVTCYQVKSL